MLTFSVIGNLGADAKVENYNGQKFVSFNVGENYRYKDEQGNERTSTNWVSCALNGDGGKLLPFLKKGRPVYVQGRGSVRCYSSPKERRWVGAANISVDRIELLPYNEEEVPRSLYTEDGVLYQTFKAYYISQDNLKELKPTKTNPAILYDASFQKYSVSSTGFVTKVVEQTQATQANQEQQTQANG